MRTECNHTTKHIPFDKRERRSFLEEELRERTREWIVEMVNEELDIALGMEWYERGEGRLGYRKGFRMRAITTSNGKHEIALPRAEFFEPDPVTGKRAWNSRLVPRYARRSEEVEEALVNSYLCGTNTRKIKKALGPLLQGAELSRSTISRILAKLSRQFDEWQKKDLTELDIAIVFLDGFNLKVRWAGKVEKVPVLSSIGVGVDGRKHLLSLTVRSSESEEAWRAVTEDLSKRGVKKAVLSVIDGNGGLRNAVGESWPWIDVQRCTKHKLENLYSHAPKRLYDEIKQSYQEIIYAEDKDRARKAWKTFEKRWEKRCPEVVESLREAGDELLTFFDYPKMMWESIRTTNSIERLNEEFRRRVKTQGSFPNRDSGLKLLFGLVATGVISMQRINGYRELPAVVAMKRIKAGLIEKNKVDHAA